MMHLACMAALWLLPAVAAGSDACKRGCAPAVEAVMASVLAEDHGGSNGQQLLQMHSWELQPKATQKLLKQDAIRMTMKESRSTLPPGAAELIRVVEGETTQVTSTASTGDGLEDVITTSQSLEDIVREEAQKIAKEEADRIAKEEAHAVAKTEIANLPDSQSTTSASAAAEEASTTTAAAEPTTTAEAAATTTASAAAEEASTTTAAAEPTTTAEAAATTTASAALEEASTAAAGLYQVPANIRGAGPREEELQFVHIPCTFGHTVEEAGLGVGLEVSYGAVENSSKAADDGDFQQAMEIMDAVTGPGGVLWGEMIPQARAISNVTGCNMYYTPPMLWPADLAEHFWKNKTAFTLLRDPYDRLANEFRLQALGVDSVYLGLSREAISQREGNLEREGDEYQRFYSECDVNGYLQTELRKYLAGDRYRVNCHLLPSAEFLKTPYGPVLPINERGIPESFNDFMELHGSSVRMDGSIHNFACNDISAYSLSKETKDLIKQVYAADFDLICKHFGFCDSDEMFCHENIEDMCGSKPESS